MPTPQLSTQSRPIPPSLDLAVRATDALIDAVENDPMLLAPWIEDDLNELAALALVLAGYPTDERREQTISRIGQIRAAALAQYVAANIDQAERDEAQALADIGAV